MNYASTSSNKGTPTMHLHVSHFSHRGKVREQNEDALLVREEQGLFVVCDGVGGSAAGEVASALCCDAMGIALHKLRPLRDLRRSKQVVRHQRDALHAALVVANEVVWDRAKSDKECHGMATTAVAALFSPGAVNVAWAGDSRCYILKGRQQLFRITTDHNLLEVLVAQGQPREFAMQNEHAGTLLNCIGGGKDVVIDTQSVAIEPGDVLLLCTDGVHGVLHEGTVAHLLAGPNPGAELLAAVLDGPAPDNATAIIVEVTT